jgi:hypothetical protein
MSDHSIRMTQGIPTTVLPDPSPELAQGLAGLTELAAQDRLAAAQDLAQRHPSVSVVWAELGDLGRETLERYAYYRVGYHRGLDALRANGWRGSGYVRWAAPSNRGFLRCLAGLAQMAAAIGESAEAERCELFCAQLDPSWNPIHS